MTRVSAKALPGSSQITHFTVLAIWMRSKPRSRCSQLFGDWIRTGPRRTDEIDRQETRDEYEKSALPAIDCGLDTLTVGRACADDFSGSVWYDLGGFSVPPRGQLKAPGWLRHSAFPKGSPRRAARPKARS